MAKSMVKKVIKPNDNGEARKAEIKKAKEESKLTMFGQAVKERFNSEAKKDGTL